MLAWNLFWVESNENLHRIILFSLMTCGILQIEFKLYSSYRERNESGMSFQDMNIYYSPNQEVETAAKIFSKGGEWICWR